jgi:hypothetical protein
MLAAVIAMEQLNRREDHAAGNDRQFLAEIGCL